MRRKSFGPPALAAGALLVAFLSGCAGSQPPVPYQRGQAIALERWTLKVRHPEVISPSLLAGFEDFRISNEKAKVIAVHLALEAGDSGAAEDPHAAERGFLKLMADCRLKDRDGHEYPLGLPVPNSQFGLMKSGGAISEQEVRDLMLSGSSKRLPRDWVLLFAVPKDRSGFTLLIRNRRPLEGQPPLVSVDLGR